MAETVDCVVIGAGVVGLAVARRLAMAGREVIVLEAADMIGTETSSRNSEVIHAGIYYPTDSYKARACVEGKHFLYEYCAAHGVAHQRIGKLIVATEESQVPKLEALRAQAAANGVMDLEPLDVRTIEKMEATPRYDEPTFVEGEHIGTVSTEMDCTKDGQQGICEMILGGGMSTPSVDMADPELPVTWS